MEEACDPMLLEWEFCFSVPPPRTDTTRSPPSVAALVQVSAPTIQDEPSNGDDVVLASPASSEERLGCFLDAIQKKLAPPLLTPQPVQRCSRHHLRPYAQQLKTRQQQTRQNPDLPPW
jgi:hypothetical protein